MVCVNKLLGLRAPLMACIAHFCIFLCTSTWKMFVYNLFSWVLGKWDFNFGNPGTGCNMPLLVHFCVSQHSPANGNHLHCKRLPRVTWFFRRRWRVKMPLKSSLLNTGVYRLILMSGDMRAFCTCFYFDSDCLKVDCSFHVLSWVFFDPLKTGWCWTLCFWISFFIS